MKKYSLNEFRRDINILAQKIDASKYDFLYGVPRGGIPVAFALSVETTIPITDKIISNTLVVDDLVDSGATRDRYNSYDFACIHIKEHTPEKFLPTYYVSKEDEWVQYWWEVIETSAEDAITRLIEYIGEDPNREGLKETPKRVIKAFDYLFSGYKIDPQEIVKTFDEESYDQIVLLKDIELYSMCEHHMLPFVGKAHVAYIPNHSVIGISKLARLVEVYSRRLQIQERIGTEITDALMQYLKPKGAACIIEAQHLCMQMRGVEKQNSVMVTSSLKGAFLDDSSAREELMRLIR
jgi:GTP cyclohydrolase I